ncbi:hypothetical protein MUB24_16820 [Lederbergia sp. NSJ-179]|uniref:hypothetical protein n=1 Tax=Lederbergia sp. NSJ-179 TaxID=2931402 RepID=UPI001FD0CBA5|nr:hypothetical protein [Lederbergia sp. NSJ-179]MCJ7842528.1 hypothetical protein [Lederbergia sp. NSJ-179]
MKENMEKVVQFGQSKSKATRFRHDHPISRELQSELLEVYKDFVLYVSREEYAEPQSWLKEFIEAHSLEKEKIEALEINLMWWKVLYKSDDYNYVENYIFNNIRRLNQSPIMIHWLKEWEKATPKFYYVGYTYSDRVFILIDLLTEETVEVIVLDACAVPPAKGEIMMGTLIPIGDALYFPILDFYHFDLRARNEIALHLHENYRKCVQETSIFEAFFRILSEVLQIEHLVTTEKQERITSQ